MRIRILVVEEERVLADSIVCGLRVEGYSVELAVDSDAATRALLTKHWDLVVLGWWLSERDRVLRAFRASDRATPAIFLTSRDATADRAQALNAGTDAHLCKPFDLDELLARVRSLLRRRRPTAEPVLRYADLSVDVATQRVERARRVVNLTPKEYSLLLYLLHNAEYVLSREQLYEHVWGDGHDGISNTVEVHVMALRRKLEAAGERLIQTVRGRGYKLQELQLTDES
ncbi:MAG TPA: response regulator transcription factor [Pirellulales bacterium]|nr:response regulator transcription factor [Pirellulales bacterium]